jgi:hypothetical protein
MHGLRPLFPTQPENPNPMEALMSNPLADVTSFDMPTAKVRARAPNGSNVTAAKLFAAIREGLGCMQHYENLRAEGLPHAAASEKACAFSN